MWRVNVIIVLILFIILRHKVFNVVFVVIGPPAITIIAYNHELVFVRCQVVVLVALRVQLEDFLLERLVRLIVMKDPIVDHHLIDMRGVVLHVRRSLLLLLFIIQQVCCLRRRVVLLHDHHGEEVVVADHGLELLVLGRFVS